MTIPDLFIYWLTGKLSCEYTNATTTQLVDAERDRGRRLMERTGD